MHIRSLPLVFGTTTGFASHSGWMTSRMKPGLQELRYLLADEGLPLQGLAPYLLPDGSGVRPHVSDVPEENVYIEEGLEAFEEAQAHDG
uniref:Uncharacterized protein n=2 Tax=Oryza sativa subsp. japonica TaxID=39947 RepID=Q10IK1_ORYSJ|nr:hypothetical protein [Oryza sativa Japonica Group]ABF96988.1 retrotransposon protein, putative, unclassified [Oryza sativa Japonica Group]